ncbi:MAG: alcohol dehydrogenase catalytic domain-containing protein [Planctomycetes bacterium]|nr:alcohol dehydrogenase catalytic domain-containing protein [Planctomycetota bacterium]
MRVTNDRPVPVPGPGEVLIRVLAAGICGTDRHIYNWDESMRDMVRPPLVPGHEFCGEVAEVGRDVPASVAVGDYVSAEMHVVCGSCYQCRTGQGHTCHNTLIYGIHRDGAFAEYVRVPATNVIRLDRDRVPVSIGAFLDALGNAVHTVLRVPVAGKSVCITGYGPIGAMAAAVAHFCGAGRIHITDVNPYSLAKAREWKTRIEKARAGHPFVHIHDVGPATREEAIWRIQKENGDGVDVVLEMSGSPVAVNDALKVVRSGGDVVLLGLPRSSKMTLENYKGDLVMRGVTMHGIIGRRMYETWYRMLAMIEAGLDVSHVVTHEVPLSGFVEAMGSLNRGEGMKVVLYPGGK